jgi:hypothetical protein
MGAYYIFALRNLINPPSSSSGGGTVWSLQMGSKGKDSRHSKSPKPGSASEREAVSGAMPDGDIARSENSTPVMTSEISIAVVSVDSANNTPSGSSPTSPTALAKLDEVTPLEVEHQSQSTRPSGGNESVERDVSDGAGESSTKNTD